MASLWAIPLTVLIALSIGALASDTPPVLAIHDRHPNTSDAPIQVPGNGVGDHIAVEVQLRRQDEEQAEFLKSVIHGMADRAVEG